MKQKNILFVVAEASGFVATGGLAEVAGSLPSAIMKANKGYKVQVVLPLYKSIFEKYKDKLEFVGETTVILAWRSLYCGIYTLKQGKVTYYFIDNKYYFDRDNIYGYDDDGERFAFFSKSIFQLMTVCNFTPDIIHANDWHTALVNIYLDIMFKKQGLHMNTKSIFTIHNIEFQGKYDHDFLGNVLGINEIYFELLEYNGLINLVKGAIVCSDVVTTVSPTYAKEIQTAEYAFGLEHVINQNKDKIKGVINGIDIDFYNPKTDEELHLNYDELTLNQKASNKEALQRGLNLEINPNICLISIISRLTSQKGMDLIINVFEELMQENVQIVILGKGDSQYEKQFSNFAAKYPKRVSSLITFDVKLAKKIYGSSDYFLMPSRTEPCGLSQMIASRYGTIPIVRQTGGLFDTIKDYAKGRGNGFAFKEYDSKKMLKKIKEAIRLFENNDAYMELCKKAMQVDFSWVASAKSYILLFKELLKNK